MSEEYFDKIGSLLCNSYKGDTEDDSLSCFDYGIEDKFSSECGAWRVIFHDSPTKENMLDYMTIKNDFQTCFRIDLRYRAWRIKAEKNDPISAGAHPGWSLYNLQERYLKVRKLIQDNPKYSVLQKKTYIVLMSSGLLSAVINEPTDEAFYNLFMKSNIAKQALKDRDMLLDYCYGRALCGAMPDMFNPAESTTIPDVDPCFKVLPPPTQISPNKDILPIKTNAIDSKKNTNKKIKNTLFAVGCVAYFSMGIVQIAATVVGFEAWLGWTGFVAILCSIFVGFMPVLGTIVGIMGAINGWEWSPIYAILLFCWPVIIYICTFLGGIIVDIFEKRENQNDFNKIESNNPLENVNKLFNETNLSNPKDKQKTEDDVSLTYSTPFQHDNNSPVSNNCDEKNSNTYQSADITNIILPNSTKRVNDCPFEKQSNLNDKEDEQGLLFNADKTILLKCNKKDISSVIIPEGVKIIGEKAFYNCSNLVSIKIPKSVETIESQAFYGCSNLLGIKIPCNIKTIMSETFVGVQEIIYNNYRYDPPFKVDNYGAFIDNEKQRLLYVPPDISGCYVIPDRVEIIEDGAFSGCVDLIKVIFSDCVEVIGARAFNNCTSLTHLELPLSLVEIRDEAFKRCSSLERIELPDSVLEIGKNAFQEAGCDNQVKCDNPLLFDVFNDNDNNVFEDKNKVTQ